MTRLASLGILLAMTVAGAATQPTISAQDFARQAAVFNMFGMESATMALHKSASPEIKAFAHRLAGDRGADGSGLRRITATRSDVALPDRPDSRRLDLLRDLGDLKGADFDKAYVAAQSQVHDEAATLLATYAKDGGDPELQAFAARSLPKVEELRKLARDLPAGQ